MDAVFALKKWMLDLSVTSSPTFQYHVWMLGPAAPFYFENTISSAKEITPRYVKMKILPLHFNVYIY